MGGFYDGWAAVPETDALFKSVYALHDETFKLALSTIDDVVGLLALTYYTQANRNLSPDKSK